MRKHTLRLFCTLLVLVLCLCSCAAAETSTPPDSLHAYQEVLLGSRSYTRCNLFDDEITEDVRLSGDVFQWYGFMFDPPLTYEAFSITDLDADGTPDVLLRLSGEFGFELLREDGGIVYGFPFFARAMEYVTADGAIHGSNGAEDFGWYRVRFAGAEIHIAETCWKYDTGDGVYLYFIGDGETDEAAFSALNEQLWAMESIAWTEYTPEAFAQAIVGL